MDEEEQPLPRGDVEEHYCGVFTAKDVELMGELYDIEYEVMDWDTWTEMVMAKTERGELNRAVTVAMVKKLNGKEVDWWKVGPAMGTHLQTFAIRKFKGVERKNSGGASGT